MVYIEDVVKATGLTGEYQTGTVQEWYNEVIDTIKDAGVAEKFITTGLVARGVLDLWNYDSGGGKLSEYFYQRVTQLAYKK